MRVLYLFLYIFCFLNFNLAEAAGVRISPTKVRLIIPPGESKSGIIEVENPSDEALIVKAYLEDWVYSSLQDGTKDFFPAGTTLLSSAEWISFSLSEFVIPAFGRQVINYTVKMPPEGEDGHYAVLFFESHLGRPELKEGAKMNVVVRIGTLFYIEPAGTIKRLAEISNLSLKKSSKNEPLEIKIDFKNIGNVDITCAGTFHIMDAQGLVSARGQFNDVYALPGDTAKLTGTWKEPLLKGKYDLILTFDLGKALREANLGSGPVITKEAEIEIGRDGQLIRVGELQ